MRATDGTTWLPIAESARIARVRVETIRQWTNRGKVASWKLSGRVWVRHDDVLDCELEWSRRTQRLTVALSRGDLYTRNRAGGVSPVP